ncbi:hypothetical protein AAY473_031038 [Plecturocebus cupreus]
MGVPALPPLPSTGAAYRGPGGAKALALLVCTCTREADQTPACSSEGERPQAESKRCPQQRPGAVTCCCDNGQSTVVAERAYRTAVEERGLAKSGSLGGHPYIRVKIRKRKQKKIEGLQSSQSSVKPLYLPQRQVLTMLPRLGLNSWVQVIPSPLPPKVLGSPACATTPTSSLGCLTVASAANTLRGRVAPPEPQCLLLPAQLGHPGWESPEASQGVKL